MKIKNPPRWVQKISDYFDERKKKAHLVFKVFFQCFICKDFFFFEKGYRKWEKEGRSYRCLLSDDFGRSTECFRVRCKECYNKKSVLD